MARLPLLVVWCVALVLLTVTGANGLYVLELTQVVHRSGVRPPPAGVPNRTKLCSPKNTTDCNAIANRGVQQESDMGNYIQRLYSGDSATVNSATWFESSYNPEDVQTRSFAGHAALQAANALLKGIYAAENSSITPAVMATTPDQDTLLNVEAFPSFTLTKELNADALNNALGDIVDAQFPDLGVLSAMGAEVGMEGVCSVPSRRASCCHWLHELLAMHEATGETDSTPTVVANKPKLIAVEAARHHLLYGHSTGVAMKVARGSLGQPLAQELLRNMRRKMLPATNTGYNAKRVMQYVHNVPISTTLGHNPSNLTPPVETFLVDLLRDERTGGFFVRLRHAAVGAAAAATPAAVAFPFRCLNAANVPTDAATPDGLICPFDDFARFVESSTGTDTAGAACYLDASTKEQLDCVVEGRPPTEECARYRAMCPAQACPTDCVYDVMDGSCWPLMLERSMITGGVMAGVCVVLAVAGFMLAIICLEMCPVVIQRVKGFRRAEATETSNEAMAAKGGQ
ncbi:putative membrane-bound acid phosphatase [Trypanosoma grayi]|uniref:putative membrane-bound acid phosphatase n=1 Tax=Trypanosoma grayi TaxID=71804 RepID=UPI0004F42B4C|nr:putative membrane-bound acid phosphatase [Trypanosoma grayi]KEG10103.1 putative membrane-bound acid phosphatase [Trypanosoma grayi]